MYSCKLYLSLSSNHAILIFNLIPKPTLNIYEFNINTLISEPDDWHKQYKTCKGKYQSPIDIEDSYVEKVNLPLLRFHNIDLIPRTTSIKNNGHTGNVNLFLRYILALNYFYFKRLSLFCNS